jgi:hypothetical protein
VPLSARVDTGIAQLKGVLRMFYTFKRVCDLLPVEAHGIGHIQAPQGVMSLPDVTLQTGARILRNNGIRHTSTGIRSVLRHVTNRDAAP